MLTNEDIQLLSDLIDKKLDPIREQLEAIKEDTDITRTTTNEIVEWIDEYFREDYPFPLGTPPKQKIKIK